MTTKLLTKALEAKLPRLYASEGVPAVEKIAVVKFFSPFSAWRWYAVEGERQEDGDLLFFGWVNGMDGEWGYFTLSELASATIRCGGVDVPAVERDLYWQPTAMAAVLDGTTY